MWGLLVVGSLSAAWAQEPHTEQPIEFPSTMAWSAYNLGTTGYNQAVAIGKVLKDHYDTNLRVFAG